MLPAWDIVWLLPARAVTASVFLHCGIWECFLGCGLFWGRDPFRGILNSSFLLSNTFVFYHVGAFGRWDLALRAPLPLSPYRAQGFFLSLRQGFSMESRLSWNSRRSACLLQGCSIMAQSPHQVQVLSLRTPALPESLSSFLASFTCQIVHFH